MFRVIRGGQFFFGEVSNVRTSVGKDGCRRWWAGKVGGAATSGSFTTALASSDLFADGLAGTCAAAKRKNVRRNTNATRRFGISFAGTLKGRLAVLVELDVIVRVRGKGLIVDEVGETEGRRGGWRWWWRH